MIGKEDAPSGRELFPKLFLLRQLVLIIIHKHKMGKKQIRTSNELVI